MNTYEPPGEFFEVLIVDNIYGIESYSYYRPKRSFGQGNIFTRVCHSVNRGGGLVQIFGGGVGGVSDPNFRGGVWSKFSGGGCLIQIFGGGCLV